MNLQATEYKSTSQQICDDFKAYSVQKDNYLWTNNAINPSQTTHDWNKTKHNQQVPMVEQSFT